MGKRLCILLAALLFNLPGYSQYSISGYIKTGGKEKTVYLSLLQYNEEVAIYPGQVLAYTKTDTAGYFELTGRLLPQVNKLYRIHSNRYDTEGLDFFEEGAEKNYHNFIFSNSDTIFFPRGDSAWFGNALNTNKADRQWRDAVEYERKLTEEYSRTRNTDAVTQAETDFLNQYKQYCNDSLPDPLVKLLAYSHIKRNVSSLEEDYKRDPAFYNSLLDRLNECYSATSYYSQFLEEMSKLSISFYKQRMGLFKRVSYALGGVIILLTVIVALQHIKIRKERTKPDSVGGQKLTAQEKKVAELICAGMSNKEIADRLFTSLSTVKTHVGNIYTKLNASDRQELIQKLQNHTGY